MCARTIWHGSAARQRVLLSRGKIINHNLDGEGARDGFCFHFRADGSTGGQFFREGFTVLSDGCVRKGGRNPAGPGAREELGAVVLGGSAPQPLTAVLLQKPHGGEDHLL